ncbi:MAG: hypothetical protein FJX35_15320 [Alphaproteobacteria bacterium]|nr:hypothetical protein [Alphaproteobacteria bacterium]
MLREAVEKAAGLLIEARRTGRLLDGLPADCRPTNAVEAMAIQEATVAGLGEPIGGWKTGPAQDGTVVRGALLRSRIFESPARVPATLAPLLGIEGEIAFHFHRDLPRRGTDYSEAEVADAVTAFAAIEIVDTRFRSFKDAPALERTADLVSNGAFVRGALQPRWRSLDLPNLEVVLTIGGQEVVRRMGGHATGGHPMAPAVLLVNELRKGGGVKAGMVMTTGTCTGMTYAKPGQTVTAQFAGLGSAEVTFSA